MISSAKIKLSRVPVLAWGFIGLLFLVIVISFYYKNPKSLPVTTAPPPAPTQAAVTKPVLSGIYKGDLPCADCPGITETLILAEDGSYVLEDQYQERSEKPYKTLGKWEADENILKLMPSDNSQPSYFQILEGGNLQMLDSNKQKIDSPFNQILSKQT